MYCLICHQKIIHHHTWNSMWEPLMQICEACREELETIPSTICEKCGRASKRDFICDDCIAWEQNPRYKNILEYNRALFTYNDKMKEIVYRWKYRGDYELVHIFKPYIAKQFTQLYPSKKFPVVPIPLTEDRMHERGFNQAEAIARLIHLQFRNPVIHALIRREDSHEKQSKKSRQERIQAKNPFILKRSINKPIILVDDIYTTGTTIHHAAKIIKEAGCPAVYSFTLIR